MDKNKFEEAVTQAEEIKSRKTKFKEEFNDFGMIFQAARAMLDDSQSPEQRVSNAEGYLQHARPFNNLEKEETTKKFDQLVRELYD